MAIPSILKGETSKPVRLALSADYDYSGCVLVAEFAGVSRVFDNLVAGGEVALGFTAEETTRFPLGTSKVFLALKYANGEVRYLPWAKIKVTDAPAELYDAAIAIDPAGTLHGMEGLPDHWNENNLRDKINEIIRRLGGTVAALAACALSAFAAGVTVKSAPKGSIYNDQPIVTNVVFDAAGLATETYVNSAVANLPPPDFSTSNATLRATIEAVAPAPGDYANVSNRAVNAIQMTDEGWQEVIARTDKITNDMFSARYFFAGRADSAINLESEDGGSLLLYYNGRWTSFYWGGLQYRPLAYLSEVDTAAQSATNYTDAAATAATNYTDTAVAGKLDARGSEYTIWSGTPGLVIDSEVGLSRRAYIFSKPGYEGDPNTVARLSDIPESVAPSAVTNIVRDMSLGGIWDRDLEVWWTPVMSGGSLTYQATTNVNLNAED